MNPKEPIWLYGDIPANSSVTEKHEFRQDVTLTELWARNYIGHGFDVQYHYSVKDKEGKKRNLFTHLDKEFLAGDDDRHNPTIRKEIKKNETLIVKVVNNSSNYAYHYNTYVVADKEGNTLDNLANRIASYFGGDS
jgi:hypothetical protein